MDRPAAGPRSRRRLPNVSRRLRRRYRTAPARCVGTGFAAVVLDFRWSDGPAVGDTARRTGRYAHGSHGHVELDQYRCRHRLVDRTRDRRNDRWTGDHRGDERRTGWIGHGHGDAAARRHRERVACAAADAFFCGTTFGDNARRFGCSAYGTRRNLDLIEQRGCNRFGIRSRYGRHGWRTRHDHSNQRGSIGHRHSVRRRSDYHLCLGNASDDRCFHRRHNVSVSGCPRSE